jgi:hypothetical protein
LPRNRNHSWHSCWYWSHSFLVIWSKRICEKAKNTNSLSNLVNKFCKINTMKSGILFYGL